jgi:hypothetical protein
MKVARQIDYSRSPIVVLGVNHSGTRVVVDILNVLGSDGGDCDNQWRENKFFLNVHNQLVDAVDGMDWTRKIFGLRRINSLELAEAKKKAIQRMIEQELPIAYPTYATKPWHWKCPTSALFLDFWLEFYADAYFVHIVRDPLDVAQSLISRRQFYTIRSARKFYDLMEERLAKASTAKNYIKLNYESLAFEVPKLIQFMPFLDASRIDDAKKLIREPTFHWKANRSLKHNLWNASAAIRVAVAKALRSVGYG